MFLGSVLRDWRLAGEVKVVKVEFGGGFLLYSVSLGCAERPFTALRPWHGAMTAIGIGE